MDRVKSQGDRQFSFGFFAPVLLDQNSGQTLVSVSVECIDFDRLFKLRDKNQDGFLTLAEYIGNPKGRNVPALTRQFKKRDANGDSKLTLKELKNTQ